MYSPLALFSSSFRASWARVAFKWLLQPETFSPHRQFYLQREDEPAYMELAPSIGSLVLREFGSIFPQSGIRKEMDVPEILQSVLLLMLNPLISRSGTSFHFLSPRNKCPQSEP